MKKKYYFLTFLICTIIITFCILNKSYSKVEEKVIKKSESVYYLQTNDKVNNLIYKNIKNISPKILEKNKLSEELENLKKKYDNKMNISKPGIIPWQIKNSYFFIVLIFTIWLICFPIYIKIKKIELPFLNKYSFIIFFIIFLFLIAPLLAKTKKKLSLPEKANRFENILNMSVYERTILLLENSPLGKVSIPEYKYQKSNFNYISDFNKTSVYYYYTLIALNIETNNNSRAGYYLKKMIVFYRKSGITKITDTKQLQVWRDIWEYVNTKDGLTKRKDVALYLYKKTDDLNFSREFINYFISQNDKKHIKILSDKILNNFYNNPDVLLEFYKLLKNNDYYNNGAPLLKRGYDIVFNKIEKKNIDFSILKKYLDTYRKLNLNKFKKLIDTAIDNINDIKYLSDIYTYTIDNGIDKQYYNIYEKLCGLIQDFDDFIYVNNVLKTRQTGFLRDYYKKIITRAINSSKGTKIDKVKNLDIKYPKSSSYIRSRLYRAPPNFRIIGINFECETEKDADYFYIQDGSYDKVITTAGELYGNGIIKYFSGKRKGKYMFDKPVNSIRAGMITDILYRKGFGAKINSVILKNYDRGFSPEFLYKFGVFLKEETNISELSDAAFKLCSEKNDDYNILLKLLIKLKEYNKPQITEIVIDNTLKNKYLDLKQTEALFSYFLNIKNFDIAYKIGNYFLNQKEFQYYINEPLFWNRTINKYDDFVPLQENVNFYIFNKKPYIYKNIYPKKEKAKRIWNKNTAVYVVKEINEKWALVSDRLENKFYVESKYLVPVINLSVTNKTYYYKLNDNVNIFDKPFGDNNSTLTNTKYTASDYELPGWMHLMKDNNYIGWMQRVEAKESGYRTFNSMIGSLAQKKGNYSEAIKLFQKNIENDFDKSYPEVLYYGEDILKNYNIFEKRILADLFLLAQSYDIAGNKTNLEIIKPFYLRIEKRNIEEINEIFNKREKDISGEIEVLNTKIENSKKSINRKNIENFVNSIFWLKRIVFLCLGAIGFVLIFIIILSHIIYESKLAFNEIEKFKFLAVILKIFETITLHINLTIIGFFLFGWFVMPILQYLQLSSYNLQEIKNVKNKLIK